MMLYPRRFPAHNRVRAATVAVIVALLAGAFAPAALADGDPASDVLTSYPYFLDWDANASPTEQADLGALLQRAARDGYPVRVAVIAHPDDLGSIAQLWGKPVVYAKFLGIELSYTYTGRVLVVMPDGIGLYSSGQLSQAEYAAAPHLPAPGNGGAALVAGAVAAVRTLASADGHPIAGAIAVHVPSAPSSGSSALPWIVFAGGALLIVIAWTWSLRVRPLAVREDSATVAG